MFEILSAHQDLISKFGGHHMAAGMTMEIDNIDALSKGLNEWMVQLSKHTSLEPTKYITTKLSEDEITVSNIHDIKILKPFGTDFENLYLNWMIQKLMTLKRLEKIKII